MIVDAFCEWGEYYEEKQEQSKEMNCTLQDGGECQNKTKFDPMLTLVVTCSLYMAKL